mmetsp:Transcript_9422/g.10325  ORF Transcript_9422/g.10325 Transcript_9422/m.10325 type:complete len:151 (-) Transcript_9422:499-951(-)
MELRPQQAEEDYILLDVDPDHLTSRLNALQRHLQLLNYDNLSLQSVGLANHWVHFCRYLEQCTHENAIKVLQHSISRPQLPEFKGELRLVCRYLLGVGTPKVLLIKNVVKQSVLIPKRQDSRKTFPGRDSYTKQSVKFRKFSNQPQMELY